jgi:hypothetical protein
MAVVVAIVIPFVSSYVNYAKTTQNSYAVTLLNDAVSRYQSTQTNLSMFTGSNDASQHKLILAALVGTPANAFIVNQTITPDQLVSQGQGLNFRFVELRASLPTYVVHGGP